jgi:branched-chain amino acid transport system permease protein
VALGFVLIFRATNVVNFAQGEFSMVAAYLMVVFAVDLQWPYGWAFVASLAGMALLGAIFNLGVYYPLRNRTFLPVIIATIGASIFLANSVLAIVRSAAAGAGGLVRDAGHPGRPGLSRQPVPADHRA